MSQSMASPGGFLSLSPRQGFAGVISKIRLENFMCHSNLVIELGEYVNFITGQNGSGKSAILTALCVAFGCRAKDTNRASTLKDFIKTGFSYASVHVEIKNQGDDAFKPEIYGDIIILERKISDSTSSSILKDHQGRKVASRKDDIRELVDHFNIDVENPCVIMSQDKSREFLHSGNAKDKFKFFFKATLLQQVNDLLLDIRHYLSVADGFLQKLEESIRPIIKELNELQVKIKNMEHVEEISLRVQQLRKKLAWSWVYDVDKNLQRQSSSIEKLKERIPTCQSKIDAQNVKVKELKETFNLKKTEISRMMEKTSEVRRMKEDLEHHFSLAMREKHELEEEQNRKTNLIEKMVKRVRLLEQQIRETQELQFKNTQAEESEFEEKLKEHEDAVNAADMMYIRFKEEEKTLSDSMFVRTNEIRKVAEEIDALERKYRETISSISELRQHQGNKVTAFGGERVLNLLRAIERNHYAFKKPPIGPIGVHVTMLNDEFWAPAVENSLGKILNAFIVTDHKDSQVLRECAKEANYGYLQIIIYDFLRPMLNLPMHMLPQTNHPTTLSVIHSENITVLNVLIDVVGAERQVLLKNYDVGKIVAFDPRISNLKEVFTLDGYRMFFRGSVQTILPAVKRTRTARLCKSFDEQIKGLEEDAKCIKEQGVLVNSKKRTLEQVYKDFQDQLQLAKRKCLNAERDLMSKKLLLSDVRKSFLPETNPDPTTTVDELSQEISKVQEEMNETNILLETIQVKINGTDAKARDVKLSLQNLCESAKGEIDAFEEAEQEMIQIEENLHAAEAEKIHYEGLMNNKVLHDIREAEAKFKELEHERKENCEKASIICPESEIQELGGSMRRTPEELSAELSRLRQTLRRESDACDDSIDDLRKMHEKKKRKISRKKQTFDGFREKLTACEKAADLRWSKFRRNASLLKRQLTWQFNGHLRKKGVSGQIKVDYEQKTLSIEVKMPQDVSSETVRDTRGLSGGERSFSTLCFTLALHEMTEAPFRAMDEFDVFMDAVSRKISLDTLVDFALAHGSQWIFITPHDISMVKNGEKIKKQQMSAPRS